jgi:hypothetical protein
MDLENKTIKELEAIYQEASRKENNKITRFEVIDDSGRVYVNNKCQIELSYQDDGRTLKVFVGKQLNEETTKSFEDAKNGVGLTTHKNFEEFWKDLNEEIDK